MKLKTLALATGAVMALMTGVSQAGALATSVLDITNFKITFADGTQVDRENFSALLLTDTADVSASLGATTDNDNDNVAGTGIDLAAVSVGTVVPAYTENSFAVYSNPPQGTWALADQVIVGAPITGLNQTLGAQAGHAAYVSLAGAGDGSSTANNGLNASFNFALANPGSLVFSFDARAYLEAFTAAGEVFPTNASAQYSIAFQIVDLDNNNAIVMNWEPDALSGGGTNVGIVSEADPFDLNDLVSRNAPFNGTVYRGSALGVANTGSFRATSVALGTGNYQLTIRSTATADALRVPEPGVLALLGIGLVGLGLSRRRA